MADSSNVARNIDTRRRGRRGLPKPPDWAKAKGLRANWAGRKKAVQRRLDRGALPTSNRATPAPPPAPKPRNVTPGPRGTRTSPSPTRRARGDTGEHRFKLPPGEIFTPLKPAPKTNPGGAQARARLALPPGLRKKVEGVQSARTFAPGFSKKERGAGASPPPSKSPFNKRGRVKPPKYTR